MKTRTILVLLILSVLIPSFSVYSQNTGLNGEWKINKEKSVIPDNQLYLSGVKIQIKNDTLYTTRTYSSPDGQEYPFDENLSLDGKEAKITIYDMPRSSKAIKSAADGSIAIESSTTFQGNSGEENLIAKETWKVDSEGKMVVIEFTNKMSGVETTGTNYYDKVK
jgi:hypothetical protein